MKQKIVEVSRLRELLHYDKDTGHLHWIEEGVYQRPVGTVAGCRCRDGYIRITIDGKKYAAHRVAYALVNGHFPSLILDHINGVKDDNRWGNLRDCNYKQNSFNAKRRTVTSTGVKGVSKCRKTGKFVVRVGHENYGVYKDLELAELVAQEVRTKLHKEFANHGY